MAVLVRGDDDAALVRRLLAGLPVPVRRRVRAGLKRARPVVGHHARRHRGTHRRGRPPVREGRHRTP